MDTKAKNSKIWTKNKKIYKHRTLHSGELPHHWKVGTHREGRNFITRLAFIQLQAGKGNTIQGVVGGVATLVLNTF